MNLKNRTSCLFKIVLFIIFSIFVAEIIVLPKIEHDMLKEAGRQELVTVQQLCGAVLEKNPDVEQDFILGLRQPTKSWQEKGEQILNQYGYDEEHLLADNTLYAAYMIAWRNWTGFFLITTFLLLATSLLYFYSIIRNSNREILLILEQYLSLSKNTPPKAFATAKAFGIIEENHLGRPPHGKARRRRPPQSNGY